MKFNIFHILPLILFVNPANAGHHEEKDATQMNVAESGSGIFMSSDLTVKNQFPFSDAVLAGNTLYLSGMVGIDVKGTLVDGGIAAETHSIFRQLQSHLGSLDLNLSHVVKCLVMLDDIDEWADFNTVYMSYFKPPYPARSALGADGLALGAAIEMECIAIVPAE
tara:strand:+ start:1058 stop:1552 length:495 start_codon:yes stop_codon:yes gene_type:complete